MIEKFFTPLTSILAIAIFFLLNGLIQPALLSWRVDFSQGDQYTLSDGTRDTLGDLAEPVDLTFVYSRTLGQDFPVIRAYAQRVRELLQTYENVGGHRLHLVEIDPTPFSTAEDEALAAGISGIPTANGEPLYFGLIGRNAVDDELVIPFLDPERESTLEYDLTRLIARLDNPKPATIGVITDLQNFQGTGTETDYFVLREIAASYTVAPISPDFLEIPDSVDILLIAHAADLTERQTYLIDQFILAKGRALILVDPASKAAAAAGGVFDTSNGLIRSDLGVLGEAWGVKLLDKAVADATHALPVNIQENGSLIEVGQPLFIGIPRALMSSDDLVTAPLSLTLNLGAPGALQAFPPNGVSFNSLIRTDDAPSFIDPELASSDMQPQAVLRAYEAEDGYLVLGGRLSGRLPTAFPGGPPASELPDDPVEAELVAIANGNLAAHLDQSRESAQVIILADADVLDDGFYIDPRSGNPAGDNATFILNALDNLAGGDALTNLRSRSPNRRPMSRIDRMRDDAQRKFFAEQATLEERLASAQTRLEQLQANGIEQGFFSGDLEADLSPEERTELSALRQSVIETRSSLRDIERDFRRDIDGLVGLLRFINIWGGPLMLALLGFLVWFRQKRKPG
ncbi:MAG: GldG family protein [Hyphomonadaceae bacterium]